MMIRFQKMVISGIVSFKLQGNKALLIDNIRLQRARWELRLVLNCCDPLFLSIKWK